ncbi:MAG TPA: TlpA disulfide reductase family protein [Bryobacteraceae bacterium]|nr:TlpA disulfide reductase family protein [Bryobacteraceae bacterium]
MTRRVLAALLLSGAVTIQAAEVPRPSPDYTVIMPDGSQKKLSEYKGKVIIAEFLLTTCAHCQNTAKVLNRIQKEYGPKGVQVIGISIRSDTTADELRTFATQYGGNAFPVGRTAENGQVYAYLQHSIMNPNFYVPQIVIIDRGFTIRDYFPGGDARLSNEEVNLRAALDKVVAERGTIRKPATAAAKGRKRPS